MLSELRLASAASCCTSACVAAASAATSLSTLPSPAQSQDIYQWDDRETILKLACQLLHQRLRGSSHLTAISHSALPSPAHSQDRSQRDERRYPCMPMPASCCTSACVAAISAATSLSALPSPATHRALQNVFDEMMHCLCVNLQSFLCAYGPGRQLLH